MNIEGLIERSNSTLVKYPVNDYINLISNFVGLASPPLLYNPNEMGLQDFYQKFKFFLTTPSTQQQSAATSLNSNFFIGNPLTISLFQSWYFYSGSIK
ncbi:MAG: hypothetical protein KAJ51_08000 [Thermoplasmata archaeon]|nr:hypothetical protein [Thermoplasmata archaeon]